MVIGYRRSMAIALSTLLTGMSLGWAGCSSRVSGNASRFTVSRYAALDTTDQWLGSVSGKLSKVTLERSIWVPDNVRLN